MNKTDRIIVCAWGAICIALLLVMGWCLGGCATTATTQVMETIREDDVPEVSRQRTVVMAFGKSSIEAATPDTLNEWGNDGSGQLASGSTVTGIKAEEGIMAAVVQLVGRYLDAQAAQTTVLQDLAQMLGALRASPLAGLEP